MIYSKIIGTGSYLPENIVTNHDLEKTMDTSDQWIRERTGIQERRIAEDHQTTGTLAEQACLRAIESAGVDPAEIDLFVMGTTTPDLVFPSTACLLQKRLGLPDCGAMDVNAACSGFMYALSIADKFIRGQICLCDHAVIRLHLRVYPAEFEVIAEQFASLLSQVLGKNSGVCHLLSCSGLMCRQYSNMMRQLVVGISVT